MKKRHNTFLHKDTTQPTPQPSSASMDQGAQSTSAIAQASLNPNVNIPSGVSTSALSSSGVLLSQR